MENKKNVKWSDLNKSAKFFVISVSFFVCVVFMILVTELFSSDDSYKTYQGNVLTMKLAE